MSVALICHRCINFRPPFRCPVDLVPIHIHAEAWDCPKLLFPSRGAGDVVAKVIHAATFGIVKPCGGCGGRQDALNKAIPFNEPEIK
jgi:hypothetical protein